MRRNLLLAAPHEKLNAKMSDASSAAVDLSSLVSREFLGHQKKVHSVHWNCTGKYLATGSVDQTARVWSLESHTHVRRSLSNFHCPTSIHRSPPGAGARACSQRSH